jgi:predicted AlkP superfamily pyrophosphatase or phosphodiesterase
MADERRAFVMVWDGLRPDLISEQLTPNLYRLAAEGVRFSDSHAVFPTVTRANSASIATGALPATHGIPGNTFYAPALEAAAALATSDAAHLRRLAAHRGGRLLTCETLADRLARTGDRTVVVSTGSTGSAFLQHPTCDLRDGLLLNPGLWLGTSREQIEARIGPMPPGSLPNSEQNAWFTRAITDVLLPEEGPRLLSFWHTDPDRTQHDRGIGHPETLHSLRDADDNLGAILAALDRLDLRGSTDVVMTSDHGFSTIVGQVDVAAELVREGLKESAASTDVVVTGGAIYVQGHDPARVDRIVASLQGREGIGSIFRRVNGARLDGTGVLPLGCVGVAGELAPEILFSHDWRDDTNEHGYAGGAWSGPTSKAATHGSISPWDVRNSLVICGPSFKRGLVSDVPAGNIDIAPTLARTLDLPPVEGIDGRVLDEALLDGPDPAGVRVERATLTAESERGRFKQTLHLSKVGRTRYVDFGRVER